MTKTNKSHTHLATSTRVEELIPAPEPAEAFRRLAARRHCLFLDSALRDEHLGRYSFLTADPFQFFTVPADRREALAPVGKALQQFACPTLPGLPPFQGGAAGLLSYDLSRSLERVPRPRHEDFPLPALAVGLYDVVLAWDHLTNQAWIVSQGFPELAPDRRGRRAAERLQQFKSLLKSSSPLPPLANGRQESRGAQPLAPQFPVPGPPGLTSNFTCEEYLRTAQRAIDYIWAGDIFQVNLSQRLLFPAIDDAAALYLRLRQCNPATFAGYLDGGTFQIVSASPERFLKVSGREVETRPIKGTRQRSNLPEADLFTADELRASEKDRAENVMIVDLLRNDLSKVCTADSVRVTQLCHLEMYQTVQHLVSAIEGNLRDDCGPLDVVRAAFPGGSITGAPKVRAMEIISELEPTARGAYCGSLGYIGFDGSLDLNILIRTITADAAWWQFPVGGGIVAQSDPQAEYEETWHKADGMIRALKSNPRT